MRKSGLLFDADDIPTEAFRLFLNAVRLPDDDLPVVDETLQRVFFQKDAQSRPLERWELEARQVPCSLAELRRHLTFCGFIAETIPQSWFYTYAAWPGALLPRVFARLQDLVKAWESGVRWERIVVFGGQRALQAERENLTEALKLVELSGFKLEPNAPNFEAAGVQTELQLMQWLWQYVVLPDDLRAISPAFVDAPMKPPAVPGGAPVRPSTEDTILKWLESGPAQGDVLLSSGAPYGMAQEAAFAMLLEPRGFTVEAFGHAAPATLTVELLMREVAGTVNRLRKERGL